MKEAPGRAADVPARYLVVTVGELDQAIFAELAAGGAARAARGKKGYVITDRQAARSQVVMPKVLNRFGERGWRLCAVNRMECYIFARAAGPVEYMVATPADLDRAALARLERRGAVTMAAGADGRPVIEIGDPGMARIQDVLPETLRDIAADGWELGAINGAQLYIFTRDARSGAETTET